MCLFQLTKSIKEQFTMNFYDSKAIKKFYVADLSTEMIFLDFMFYKRLLRNCWSQCEAKKKGNDVQTGDRNKSFKLGKMKE